MWQCCHSFPFCPQGSCPQGSWSGAREARTARSRRRPRTASSAARISSWASFRVRINPNPNLHCQSKFAERRGELAVLQYLIPISCGDHIVSMIVSSSSFLFPFTPHSHNKEQGCEFESVGTQIRQASIWFSPDPRQIPLEGKSVSTFAPN